MSGGISCQYCMVWFTSCGVFTMVLVIEAISGINLSIKTLPSAVARNHSLLSHLGRQKTV